MSWRDRASCRGRGELFFATDPFSQRLAAALCRRCPVQLECADYVLDLLEHDAATVGVWGGFNVATPAARVELRSRGFRNP